MPRIFSASLVLCGLAFLAACSSDQPESSGEQKARSFDTTVRSRGVAVPVTFVTPIVAEGETSPLIVMAHGHGGSRDEGGGYRRVAASLAERGIASIRMDFPGCGDSTESFTENNVGNMLLDMQAARKFAASQDEIDDNRIGLLGFSMGARLTALLSEIDRSYKVMVLWAPAVANGAERELDSLGGPAVYHALRETAQETGLAEYTTRWGAQLQLGYRWFTDLEETAPLVSLSKFTGPLLIIYGDKDEAVPPWIPEAAIEAAQSSSEIVRHVIEGAGHDLGFYSDQPAVAGEVVNATAEFLGERL